MPEPLRKALSAPIREDGEGKGALWNNPAD
jgi:hypothetical protein